MTARRCAGIEGTGHGTGPDSLCTRREGGFSPVPTSILACPVPPAHTGQGPSRSQVALGAPSCTRGSFSQLPNCTATHSSAQANKQEDTPHRIPLHHTPTHTHQQPSVGFLLCLPFTQPRSLLVQETNLINGNGNTHPFHLGAQKDCWGCNYPL